MDRKVELDQSITSIEHLSNEFFYEIFDYLDGGDIYHSFSNLNYRFQELINSPSLRFKIKYDSTQLEKIPISNYREICLHNKNQILSFNLWRCKDSYQFILPCTFDSSFTCLESLHFHSIETDILKPLLRKLTCLPRLFSLSIDADSIQINLCDIYRLIFNLPKLKYLKYTAKESNEYSIVVSLPVDTNGRISSIEYLIIDHPCTSKEIFSIISYTPHLRRLKFRNLSDWFVNIRVIEPIVLSNLTHLSIYIDQMSFDDFKIFIKKLNAKIKFLLLETRFEDIDYLDANLWEEFILQDLSHLKKFYFKYITSCEKYYDTSKILGKRDQFISSFWDQRQWTLEMEINFDELICSIRPYKKKWYEYDIQIISSNQLSESIGLILYRPCPGGRLSAINDFIYNALPLARIHHLEIQTTITLSELSDILFLLPVLDSLKISSLLLPKASDLSKEEIEQICLLATKNQTTKIYLENITHIQKIYILILICPRTYYLKINCGYNVDIKLFVRRVLSEIKTELNYLLRLLCFSVPQADDFMVEKLEKMINAENLLVDFKMKRVMDNIYLLWK